MVGVQAITPAVCLIVTWLMHSMSRGRTFFLISNSDGGPPTLVLPAAEAPAAFVPAPAADSSLNRSARACNTEGSKLCSRLARAQQPAREQPVREQPVVLTMSC